MKGTQILFDKTTTDGIEYVGIAASGVETNQPQWQIKAVEYDGSDVVSVKFADGTCDYNQVWDDRADLIYS